MKKLICLLAVVGLIAGCASHNTGGTSDQTQMNSGAESSYPGVTNRTLQAP